MTNKNMNSSSPIMNAIIAALCLIFLAVFGEGTNAFADVDAPFGTGVIKTTGNKAQDQIEIPARADAKSQSKMAAVDRAELSVKLPSLAQPFGVNAVLVASGELLTNWSRVEADIRAESEILAQCRENIVRCPPAARTFLAIVAEGRAHGGRARIGMINRAINLAIRPMSDLAQWGVEDRWTAPLATFTTGFGDCEDYAIAKYVALVEAGVAAEDVRLIIARDLVRGGGHAVVAVRLDGRWIVLDNRWQALAGDGEMRRLIPLFVLDREGVKQFVPVSMPDTPAIGTVR
jgi:predicted transglutaminase-like cysteine proteinase